VEGPESRRSLAWLIALGIGLHNLGEGLAIGAAYALGEAALGAFLVIGFMLHNSTEGLGIVAPVAQDRPSLKTLAGLGLLAGAPTILGAWIGGLAYSPLWATIFLAVGAGAIAQVVVALYRVVARETQGPVWNPLTAGGLVAGMLVMYATGLLVAA
jgi:zinc transporter ZupT